MSEHRVNEEQMHRIRADISISLRLPPKQTARYNLYGKVEDPRRVVMHVDDMVYGDLEDNFRSITLIFSSLSHLRTFLNHGLEESHLLEEEIRKREEIP